MERDAGGPTACVAHERYVFKCTRVTCIYVFLWIYCKLVNPQNRGTRGVHTPTPGPPSEKPGLGMSGEVWTGF